MNEKLEHKLVYRFPHLYHGVYKSPDQTCMTWGFSCDDGWFDILWMLSLAIEDELELNCWWYRKWIHTVAYLCYKWNRLMLYLPKWTHKKYYYGINEDKVGRRPRFQIHYITPFEVSQVKEKFGTLSFYYYGGNHRIDNLVDLAERLSEITCMKCGKFGKLITTRGWWHVSCDECSEPGEINGLDRAEMATNNQQRKIKKNGDDNEENN